VHSNIKHGTSDEQVERCDFDCKPSFIVKVFEFLSLFTELSQSTDEPLGIEDASLKHDNLGHFEELCSQNKAGQETFIFLEIFKIIYS